MVRRLNLGLTGMILDFAVVQKMTRFAQPGISTNQKLEGVLEQLKAKQEAMHVYFLQEAEAVVDWSRQVVPVPMVKLYLDGE